MPSPRRVIESHTRQILPVAVFATLEAAKGSSDSSRHESQWSLGAELAGGTLYDGQTPLSPLGSSLPVHNEIPIPDWYMPQANVSEADLQKQAM